MLLTHVQLKKNRSQGCKRAKVHEAACETTKSAGGYKIALKRGGEINTPRGGDRRKNDSEV